MKKTIGIILLAAAICVISIAAYTERVYQPAEGFRAPQFAVSSITDDDNQFRLDTHRGRYVLLSFWSASDPMSRMRNISYNTLVDSIDAASDGIDPVDFISVNFDSSRNLAMQIARRDSIDIGKLANVQGPAAQRLIADYRLADGYRAYLIDPTGRVVALNPSAYTICRQIND